MRDWLKPETFDVPTDGGNLRVAQWGDSGPAILAIHGITASHMEWPYLARELQEEVRFIAMDLRGRGESRNLPPPYGLDVHVADCVAILDHLDIDAATVVGHSMGGFVAAIMAMRHPERVSSLVLIDGGVPLAIPAPEVDIEQLLTLMLGPSVERCKRTFESLDSYVEFWKNHPSVQDEGAWNEVFRAYVTYDLTGEEPELRSKVNLDTLMGDGRDTLTNGDLRVAIDNISCPILFIRAPRGILNEPNGLYSDEFAADLASRVAGLQDILIDDVNHFTVVISEKGAAAVATEIRKVLAPQPA